MFSLPVVATGSVAGHSRDMVAASVSEFGLESAVIASKIMADAGLELINSPEMIKTIRAEWEVVKAGN
jgi:hypothetical protein